MRKILLIFLVFSFLISPILGYGNDEAIRIDHEKGLIAGVVDRIIGVSQAIFSVVDNATDWVVNEIENRQRIIEDQIEERKDNLIKRVSNAVVSFFNSLIDSIVESISKPFRNEGGDI